MTFKTPKRDSRPFHLFLIPELGEAVRVKSAWHDADQAADAAADRAAVLFPGQAVECLVIHTMSNEAVRSRVIEPDEHVHDDDCRSYGCPNGEGRR